MNKVILLGIAFLLVTGCNRGPERTVYRGGTTHLPLLEERTMRYEEQKNGETKEYTVSMQYAGGHQSKVYPLHVKGNDLGNCEFLSRDSVVTFSTTDPLTTLEPRGMLPEYREVWINENASRGDAWQNEDTGTQTVYAGDETVQALDQTYTDCYKTVTEALPVLMDSLRAQRQRGDITGAQFDQESANARLTVVRWFAPNVGLVREQIGDDILRVLTKVEKEGRGEIDTTQVVPMQVQ